MQTDLFDYPLPEELIARVPAARRDRSRLLVIDRRSGKITHSEFANLPEFLPAGARLFRNNATVLKARLRAQRSSGGQVECLLLRPAKAEDVAYFANSPAFGGQAALAKQGNAATDSAADAAQISPWDFICLLKPGRRLKPGEVFYREGHFSAQVLDKHPDGENRVRFTPLRGQQSVVEIATLAGELPLPPYIEQARIADSQLAAQADASLPTAAAHTAAVNTAQATATAVQAGIAAATAAAFAGSDTERYQTVYADPARTVAAAAPTAGLHFTPELIARLLQQGTPSFDLTLHVGLDTFRPITAQNIEEHQIHRELYEIPAASRAALLQEAAHPRVAVGTTTLRSIEHYFRHGGSADFAAAQTAGHPAQPWLSEADIFIYPPARFAGVEALITNFHLPRSTLLCLVSAFLTPGSTEGIEQLKSIYQEAISLRYRFFSYGDAMLIL